jgi:predicted N-acetyltransferase YhbS
MKIIEGFPKDFDLKKIHQVVAMFKAQWPHGFLGDNSLRDWIHPECDSPYYLMLIKDNQVVAHTSVLTRVFKNEVLGEIRVQGLSGVITALGLRNQGLGAELVQKASSKVFDSEADLGMFSCSFKHVAFYKRLGWTELKKVELQFGKSEPFEICDEATIYKVLSDKGDQFIKEKRECGYFHFGDYLW